MYTNRNMKTLSIFLACALFALSGGCTWVKPVEGIEAVALVKANVAQNCKRLSKTTVKVQSKLGFINRNEKKVSKELLTLARNQAVAEGADTLVADSEVANGQQTFVLYKCR